MSKLQDIFGRWFGVIRSFLLRGAEGGRHAFAGLDAVIFEDVLGNSSLSPHLALRELGMYLEHRLLEALREDEGLRHLAEVPGLMEKRALKKRM